MELAKIKEAVKLLFTPNDFVELYIIALLCFFGSTGKDYLTMFKYQRKMNLIRIILSTTTSSLIVFGISGFVLEYLGIKGLMMISFIIGLVGFELLQKISTIRGIFEMIEQAIDIEKEVRGILDRRKNKEEASKEETKDDEKNK